MLFFFVVDMFFFLLKLNKTKIIFLQNVHSSRVSTKLTITIYNHQHKIKSIADLQINYSEYLFMVE